MIIRIAGTTCGIDFTNPVIPVHLHRGPCSDPDANSQRVNLPIAYVDNRDLYAWDYLVDKDHSLKVWGPGTFRISLAQNAPVNLIEKYRHELRNHYESFLKSDSGKIFDINRIKDKDYDPVPAATAIREYAHRYPFPDMDTTKVYSDSLTKLFEQLRDKEYGDMELAPSHRFLQKPVTRDTSQLPFPITPTQMG